MSIFSAIYAKIKGFSQHIEECDKAAKKMRSEDRHASSHTSQDQEDSAQATAQDFPIKEKPEH